MVVQNVPSSGRSSIHTGPGRTIRILPTNPRRRLEPSATKRDVCLSVYIHLLLGGTELFIYPGRNITAWRAHVGQAEQRPLPVCSRGLAGIPICQTGTVTVNSSPAKSQLNYHNCRTKHSVLWFVEPFNRRFNQVQVHLPGRESPDRNNVIYASKRCHYLLLNTRCLCF